MPVPGAVLEALQKAAQIETEGLEFYNQAAERTTDARGREVFRSLARDEELHLRIVRQEYESLEASGKWIAPDALEAVKADLDAPLLFPAGWDGLKGTIRPDATDQEALLFALEIENKNYLMYREAAQATEDPSGKEMYLRLASAERGHFDWVMLNYENLATVGHWADLKS